MDARSTKFPLFISPTNAAELPGELSRLAREFVKGIEWEGFVPPSNVFKSSVRDLPAFKAAIENNIRQYLSSLDIPDEKLTRIYQEAMQHDLFRYQYLDAAHSFIAEPFPYQEIPLVFYGEYNDHPRYTDMLDTSSAAAHDASVATYKNLYAHGMALLKEFSDAIRLPDTLNQYISDNKKIILPDLLREVESHPSAFTSEKMDYIKFNPESLYKMAIDLQLQLPEAIEKNLTALNEKLFSALLVTQMKFHYACETAFKKTEQYNPDCNNRMKGLLGNHVPLVSLRYYPDINCFAYKPAWRTPAMAFHSAAELIQECSSEARLKPLVMTDSPALSQARGVMFMKTSNGINITATPADDVCPSLHK